MWSSRAYNELFWAWATIHLKLCVWSQIKVRWWTSWLQLLLCVCTVSITPILSYVMGCLRPISTAFCLLPLTHPILPPPWRWFPHIIKIMIFNNIQVTDQLYSHLPEGFSCSDSVVINVLVYYKEIHNCIYIYDHSLSTCLRLEKFAIWTIL